jgi:hypothetical protein
MKYSKKPALVPLRLLEIPYALTLDWSQSTIERSQQLTTWAMAYGTALANFHAVEQVYIFYRKSFQDTLYPTSETCHGQLIPHTFYGRIYKIVYMIHDPHTTWRWIFIKKLQWFLKKCSIMSWQDFARCTEKIFWNRRSTSTTFHFQKMNSSDASLSNV